MREIIFRGKQINNGKWVYGNYIKSPISQNLHMIEDREPIIDDDGIRRFQGHPPVDPNTVGQFTGLTDKNGKRIFEGDIIKAASSDVIGEDFDAIVVANLDDYELMYNIEHSHTLEVIGNIHDNPELIAEVEE